MVVQTSQITTAANGNLSLTPNGSGQIVASPLGGSGNRPIGVDNAGTTRLFTPGDLVTGTPTAASEVMLDIGGTPQKSTAQALVDATDAIDLTDLSVTIAATGTTTGSLVYDNTTGVFTYTPVAAAASGIALTDLSVTTAAAGSATGGLAYNNTNGQFTFTPVDIPPATAAEQAAGGITNKYSSPATSVAKDAATTTGALISPSGTAAQRPAAPVRAMLRYNTDSPTWEYYDGAAWTDLVPAGSVLLPATLAEQTTGTITSAYSSPATSVAKDAATVTGAIRLSGGTVAQRPAAPATGMLRYNTERVNAEWYNGAAWADLQNESVPSVVSANTTATKDQTIVVTTSGRTITLPAAPLAGDVVSVVIAGEFTDTVVARNGSRIMGLAEDITLDKNYAAMDFIFTGITVEGWRLS